MKRVLGMRPRDQLFRVEGGNNLPDYDAKREAGFVELKSVEVPCLPFNQRHEAFAEVELAYSDEQVKTEMHRFLPFSTQQKMNIEIPIIQFADPSNSAPLAKLAEKTFRDAFAPFLNREDVENYVARSFTENQIRSELLDSASTFFIARIKDKWVGYAKLYQGPTPGCVKQLPAVELARLYSMQQYLGCGVGDALLEACITYARKKAFKSIWLSSWQENNRGNAFYAKMQFEVLGAKTFAIGSDIQQDYIFVRPLR